jgi:hypothetical protein
MIHTVRSRKHSFQPIVLQPTKLSQGTSKICPICLRPRKRRFEISMPLRREQCNPNIPSREPRVSGKHAWWNRGLVRYCIAPDSRLPWFECWEIATCRRDGATRVEENDYVRQFGRVRLLLLFLRKLIPLRELLDWFIPNH